MVSTPVSGISHTGNVSIHEDVHSLIALVFRNLRVFIVSLHIIVVKCQSIVSRSW